MATVVDFLWVSVGVALSVLLPALRKLLEGEVDAEVSLLGVRMPAWMRRYVILAAFSMLTGLLVLAVLNQAQPGVELAWYTGILAGYGWEATIEKIAGAP